MAAAVVALPQPSQAVLPADVPELEVDGGIGRGQSERDGVLADGGHGFEVRVRGRVGGFDLLEERGFASVVEAEEEDRVFWALVLVLAVGGIREERERGPSLLVACR